MANKLTELVEEVVAKVKPDVTTVDTNNILTVKRRAISVLAVQFTGKNGAEVVAFVRGADKKFTQGVDVRNGGSYVTITDIHAGGRARKGDWVVLDADGKFRVFSPEELAKLFLIKG